MSKIKVYLFLLIAILFVAMTGCKKDDKSSTDSSAKYVLVIDNPAQTISPEEHVTYTAHLVDVSGNISTPSTVTWSTSQSSVATINSSGIISVVANGHVSITAKTTVNGHDYTATVPLGIYSPSVFTVAPSAILYAKGGTVQLEAVYLTTTGYTNPTCTYASDNSAIASVSSTGLVTCVAVGECNITVTATGIQGSPNLVVPVMVIGAPEVVLPVVRVAITPASFDLFRGETRTLTAKAYNSNSAEVTSTFSWSSLDPSIATVSSAGVVTPVKPGNTYIRAIAQGISGEAEVIVNPDTFVYVTPLMANIPKGGTKQFTATAYKITRTNGYQLSGINFDWQIPFTGISIFDFATVSSNGLVSVNSSALEGLSTIVVAYDHNNPRSGGASVIMVSTCDCGAGVVGLDHITVSNSQPIQVSMMGGPVQINATGYNSANQQVSNPDFHYCVDNMAVATVTSDGQIIGSSPGSAVVTICSGNISTTVNITVGL